MAAFYHGSDDYTEAEYAEMLIEGAAIRREMAIESGEYTAETWEAKITAEKAEELAYEASELLETIDAPSRSVSKSDGSRTDFYLEDGIYSVFASIGDSDMTAHLRIPASTPLFYTFIGGQQIGFSRTLSEALAVVISDRSGAKRQLYGYYGG